MGAGAGRRGTSRLAALCRPAVQRPQCLERATTRVAPTDSSWNSTGWGFVPWEGHAPRAPRLMALPCEGHAPRAPRLMALCTPTSHVDICKSFVDASDTERGVGVPVRSVSQLALPMRRLLGRLTSRVAETVHRRAIVQRAVREGVGMVSASLNRRAWFVFRTVFRDPLGSGQVNQEGSQGHFEHLGKV